MVTILLESDLIIPGYQLHSNYNISDVFVFSDNNKELCFQTAALLLNEAQMRHKQYFAKILLDMSSKHSTEDLNPPNIFIKYYCNTAEEITTANIPK